MRQFVRMLSNQNYKGTRNYINSQKKFEVFRTIIYFLLPIGLFIIGYVTTGERTNLLTVVAVVGCLPGCKSLVSIIMYLRYRSCGFENAEMIESHIGSLNGLYDMVFTSYKQNFVIAHLVVHGNTICGFSERSDFPEKDFLAHIEDILKVDGHQNYSIKIFTDIKKYTDRLDQLNALDVDNKYVNAVLQTLKSVAL